MSAFQQRLKLNTTTDKRKTQKYIYVTFSLIVSNLQFLFKQSIFYVVTPGWARSQSLQYLCVILNRRDTQAVTKPRVSIHLLLTKYEATRQYFLQKWYIHCWY